VGLGAKGNEGVAGLVKQTPYSIGYVELIYALQNRLGYGLVRNAAGNFIKADLNTVTEAAAGAGDSFVIHRHHATRLHYDLRLEQEGVLKSWAVPKGLPPRPGVKRLAVATEDHPLSYLGFEGTIPKGEYGAGPVWVFATGKYEIIKEKKDSFHFRLHSRVVDSEFILIHTKEKDWLLDCADTPQVDWLHEPIRPMLSQVREQPFDDPDYLYEIKWDGIRALVALEDGRVTIRSRNYQDITAQFPELQSEGEFRASCGLFDAEIVCLDRDGKPIFEDVLTRMQQTGSNAVARAQSRHPATCYVFDCLYLDGCVLTGEPLERRRAWMADSLRPDKYYRISEAFDDGKRLFDAAAGMGLEGIVAKKRNSRYLPGKRSDQWLKIKAHRSLHTLVIGYTAGKGGREAHFGALHMGCWSASGIRYLGKVGSGFDERKLDSIGKELLKTPRASKPVKAQIAEEAQTVWLEPQHVCEVRYSSTTKEGVLRDAVFVRMRPDLTPEDLREPEPRG
jgi:DNA ligase D-like protein (predicted ligase)/DNA ligase D-like protein (predicted 3'-phosphoesterase)